MFKLQDMVLSADIFIYWACLLLTISLLGFGNRGYE